MSSCCSSPTCEWARRPSTTNGVLTFSFKPEINDGQPREVKAILITTASPAQAEIQLARPRRQPLAAPLPAAATQLDLTGYRLRANRRRRHACTLPPGTRLAPGGLLVIGRAANREPSSKPSGARCRPSRNT